MSKFAKTHFATKFVSNANNFLYMESSNSKQLNIEPETHYNPSSGQGNRSISRKSVTDKVQRNARTSYKNQNRAKQQESKLNSALEKKVEKIDIDPTLLFRNKHSRCSNYEKGNTRNPVLSTGIARQRKTVSRDQLYREQQTEEHLYAYQERPQSKQSSRVKIRNQQHVSQPNVEQFLQFKKQKPIRPQTSKCNRKKYFEQDFTKNHQNLLDSYQKSNDIQMKINFKSDKRITKHPMSAMNRQKDFAQIQRRHFDSSLDPQFLSLFAN